MPWLLGPVAALVAWLAVTEQRRLQRPWSFLVSDVGTGLSIVAAGLFIWSRRPQNRCWWLLVGAGFAWFVGDFEHSRDQDVALVGFAFGRWYGPLLAAAILAYPSGRLRRRRDRVLLAVIIGLFATRSLSRLFLHVPPDVAGYGTENRFLPVTDDRWWRMVEDVFGWGDTASVLLLAASVADGWVRSSRTGRKMLLPAVVASLMLAIAVTYEHATGWNAGVPSAGPVRAFHLVWWGYAAVASALAAGLVRVRGARSGVIDLLAELGVATPGGLGPALAHALGDSTLRLFVWSPTTRAYVDEQGRPTVPVADSPERAVTRVERGGVPLAALVHDVALLEDPGVVHAITSAVSLTIDNERLRSEIERQLGEVAASRARIIAAGDAERRRIERDLHDGAQQRLVTIALALRLAERRLDGDGDPSTRSVLSQSVKDLGEAIDELRDLARGIHPTILTESGLGAALESLVDRSPVPVRLTVSMTSEPTGPVTAAAYFAVSEALANAAKHSGAGHVAVSARLDSRTLRVEVVDDGLGGADARRGSGLNGIIDRVAAAGGTVKMHSPTGGGTRLEVELPCASS